MQHQQRSSPVGASVNANNSQNWRQFSDPEARYKRMSSPPVMSKQDVHFQQQQYAMQQQQLAAQFEALKLQNLEFQEKLFQAMHNQRGSPEPYPQQQPYHGEDQFSRSSRPRPPSFASPINVNISPSIWNDEQPGDETVRQQRKGALANLQKAQQNRYSDTFSDSIPSPGVNNAFALQQMSNRLSFTGGDGLAERAMARKAAAEIGLGQPAQIRGHTRGASSLSSIGSPMLSDTHKQMTSPSGPTLVLSQPGDSFPSPSLGRSKAKNLKIGVDATTAPDSDSTASSPRTPDSESEAKSFESMTSYGSDREQKFNGGVRRVVSQGLKLNPSASTFSPNTPPFVPSQASFKPSYRNFSAPSAMMNNGQLRPILVKPIRQPKGPCPDEELPKKNFSARVRSRALNTLRKGRLSAPPSPTDTEF